MASLEGDKGTSTATVVSKDGKSFHAHRSILSKASPVFEAMFRCNMMEKFTGVVKCNDLSGKCVKILIHFIYTGKLAENWSHPDVIEGYGAAKYQLEDLLQFINEALPSCANKENAQRLLKLAIQLTLGKAEKSLWKLSR